MPQGNSPAGAVVFVTDAKRVSAFYAEVAGLQVGLAEAGYVILESAATQLVIHALPAPIAATIDIASPPVRREDSYLKLVFVVESLDRARAAAAMLGGVLDPEEREWPFRGYQICDGHDPEGNVFQLREYRGDA